MFKPKKEEPKEKVYAGDYVLITKVTEGDTRLGIEVGQVYAVHSVNKNDTRANDVFIQKPKANHTGHYLASWQYTKVNVMSAIPKPATITKKVINKSVRVGDVVRIKNASQGDYYDNIHNGDRYEVVSLTESMPSYVYIKTKKGNTRIMAPHQYDVVPSERKQEPETYSFLEFMEKLTNGDFSNGTEVRVKTERTNLISRFWVRSQSMNGLESDNRYCITAKKNSPHLSCQLTISQMHGEWSVVPPEEQATELTVEEIQKLLGKKIKIVEGKPNES